MSSPTARALLALEHISGTPGITGVALQPLFRMAFDAAALGVDSGPGTGVPRTADVTKGI